MPPAVPVARSQIRLILSEADEDADGVIQYKEFLPVMVDLLQSIKVCGAFPQSLVHRGQRQEQRQDICLPLLTPSAPFIPGSAVRGLGTTAHDGEINMQL